MNTNPRKQNSSTQSGKEVIKMVDLESRDLLAALELPGVGSGTLRNAIRAIPKNETSKNRLFSLLEQTAKSNNHFHTEAELKAYEKFYSNKENVRKLNKAQQEYFKNKK